MKGMEAQRLSCPPASIDEQPDQLASCFQAIHTAPSLSVSPIILQPEQALSQTIYVKALTIPLFQPIQSEGLQPSHKLLTGQTSINLDSSNIPLILNPLLHSDGTDHIQTGIQKQPETIKIVSGFPVLAQNYSPCSPLGSPGKCKNAGKYLCKHCGRDCLKPSVLEKHVRSHTGERPFPCTICGIAFKTQSNLYKHRRTQTHVNNARLPSESDSSSPLGEHEKGRETIGSPHKTKPSDRNCDGTRTVISHSASDSTAAVTSENESLDTSSPEINSLFVVSESQWTTVDNSCHGRVNQSVLEKEIMKDPATPLQKRKIQEQRCQTAAKPSQLQRQQATYTEKLWEGRSPDYKLKKCESTDSGYMSRSDSVEQQMLSPNCLHSLCEHSTESESDTTITSVRCTAGNMAKADSTEKSTGGLTLEKKKLEEHISKLISQNKAVVDNTQLDNVRPRKTVLSKQGSIDLPMPYTYKDSFHFDIRPFDSSRKKLSQCTAKSIFTPIEKSKPLFFHSVPTQFSTTIDYVPVSRSNSMPFIESTRRIQDQADISKAPSLAKMSHDTSSALLSSKEKSASMADFPSSHPRALVRQAAVDDLPPSNTTDPSSSEEVKGTKKSGLEGEGTSTKHKKPNQRKAKMFTQEKWQVYGDETFKKIYQKMKSNQTTKKQKENKITDISSFHLGTKDIGSHDGIPKDVKGFKTENLVCSSVTLSAKPNTEKLVSSSVTVSAKQNTEELEGYCITSPPSQCGSSQSLGNFAVSVCEQSELSKTFVESSCRGLCVSKQDSSGNDEVLPFNTGCELSFQLQQTTDQEENSSPLNIANLQDTGLEDACAQGELVKCMLVEEDNSTAQDPTGKESFYLEQEAFLPKHCNSSEPTQELPKLPSERKKLKVDKLKREENVLKPTHSSSSSVEGIVELTDHYKTVDTVASESIHHLVKEESQIAMGGLNTSGSSNMGYKESVQCPIMTSEKQDDVADLSDTRSVLSLEQLGTEVKKGNTYDLYALQKLKNKPYREASPEIGDIAQAPTQHLIFDQINPSLKKNDFLPKYILKYSQGKTTGLPLILTGEPKNMPCISSAPSILASRSLGSKSTDVFLCPPTILETTSITTRPNTKCHLQRVKQKEKMKDMWKGPNNRDNLGAQELAQKSNMHTIVCTSHTPGKKICFTTMYTGGLFISSDITGQSSALQFVHSGNSSVISVSSLVERTVFCGNTDEKIEEWQSDINSFPGFQDLPTCSSAMPRCLSHSSNMLYCHMLHAQQKEVHTLPQLSSHAGDSKGPIKYVSFPNLNAEPQLTWCCLSRNLPLPVEQKEKRDSAYSSLHTCMNEKLISKCNRLFYKMKNTRKSPAAGSITGVPQTATSSVSPQQQQYFSTTGVDGLFKNIPEQERAKDKLHKMRELTAHKAKKSHKRRKVKITPKCYRGSYRQRHILFKANRPVKQHWPTTRVLEPPKKPSSPHIPNSRQHCRRCLCLLAASQGIDENPQEISEKAGSSVEKNIMKKDIPGTTTEHSSGSFSPQKIPRVSNVPAAKYSYPLATNAPAQKARSRELCSSGILQTEPQPDINFDQGWPSSGPCNLEYISTSKAHLYNFTGSHVTSPVLIGSKADSNNIELKSQNFTVSKSSVHVTGGRKQATDENFHPPLKEQPIFQNSYPVPLKSRMLLEKSFPDKSLPGPMQMQEASSTSRPHRQENCSVIPDDHLEVCEPDSVGTLSKAHKKQSLEMISKEYDNVSSSDDEDRLIIEI